jgi:hypothetical protein
MTKTDPILERIQAFDCGRGGGAVQRVNRAIRCPAQRPVRRLPACARPGQGDAVEVLW